MSYRPPSNRRAISPVSGSTVRAVPVDQRQAALESARSDLETRKELADILAEKICARSLLRSAAAHLAWDEIERMRANLPATTKDGSRVDTPAIIAKRRVRRAEARLAAAEIAALQFDHEGLLKLIELMEAQIAAVEKGPNMVVPAMLG